MINKKHDFEISKEFLNDYYIYNSLAFEVAINYIKGLETLYNRLKASNELYSVYSEDYLNGFIDGLNETIKALEIFKAREENKIDG